MCALRTFTGLALASLTLAGHPACHLFTVVFTAATVLNIRYNIHTTVFAIVFTFIAFTFGIDAILTITALSVCFAVGRRSAIGFAGCGIETYAVAAYLSLRTRIHAVIGVTGKVAAALAVFAVCAAAFI